MTDKPAFDDYGQPTRAAVETFYGSEASVLQHFHPSIKDAADRLADSQGWSQAQRSSCVSDSARLFHDARMNSGEAAIVLGTVAQLAKTPPDELTQREWETKVRGELRTRYGIDEGNRRLAQVNAYLGTKPELAKLLKVTGAGSHPDVALRLAERADHLPVEE